MSKLCYIKWFEELDENDLAVAGGKGANLGKLTQLGINVPPGFAVTVEAYNYFIEQNDLTDKIRDKLKDIDIEDSSQLQEAAREIREIINNNQFPEEIYQEIEEAYTELNDRVGTETYVAVRSSATAEDLPDASFAGQQDTYLYIKGIDELLNYVMKCWGSLWTARAIYYREQQGFDHFKVGLSAVVQKMVNSGKSGVIFTANPINNRLEQMMINSSWGLGEAVVSGSVTPDEFVVNKENHLIIEENISTKKKMIIKKEGKEIGTEEVNVAAYLGGDKVKSPSLTKEELDQLVKMAIKIEDYYGSPQDIEWAFDLDTAELYILQARPITTLKKSKDREGERVEEKKETLVPLVKGLSASPGITFGKVMVIENLDELNKVEKDTVLVTGMTNPDMVPAMRKAVAVVTDEGGRTCHAAIVSRELGIPCIVGSEDATSNLKDGMEVTVDATRGVVYQGSVLKKDRAETQEKSDSYQSGSVNISPPVTGTKIYMNLGEPGLIDKYKNLSFDGIGLMRTEFIFTNMIKAHPMYLLQQGKEDLFIDKLAEGISQVAQAIYPRQLVVRLSDFRTNEFRGLEGGDEVEPVENNPMIGWRGVARYISPTYEEGFRLECQAMNRVRNEYNLNNVVAMLPFVRTTWEVERVLKIMAAEGLERNKSFKVWLMAEVPSVIFMADEFSRLVDGFSIGSNDLTQLIMGADRDSGILSQMGYFDERDPAIKRAIKELIRAAHENDITVSICGQGPSLYPEFAEFLVKEGIDSISVNPDTVEYTRRLVAGVEHKIILNNLRG